MSKREPQLPLVGDALVDDDQPRRSPATACARDLAPPEGTGHHQDIERGLQQAPEALETIVADRRQLRPCALRDAIAILVRLPFRWRMELEVRRVCQPGALKHLTELI